mgnify:CR=1 FL=1
MYLADDLRIHDLALVHEATETVILGDTHIGEEDALVNQGIFIPQFGFKDLYKRTQSILADEQPGRIILNGDVKHNFGRISDDEWDNVHTYIDLLRSHGDVLIIRGNHDNMLDPILEKADVAVDTHVRIGDIAVCHGHKLIDALEDSYQTLIIGHEHPAITLRDGERTEAFKAFIQARTDDKTILVMPSMNQLREGSDLLQEQLMSPYLDDVGLAEADIVIIDEEKEARRFGKLKHIRNA